MAWGRVGSVAGPLAAGYLLSGGLSAGGVLLGLVPAAVVAGAAAFTFSLVARPVPE